jgi:hypothetical protein
MTNKHEEIIDYAMPLMKIERYAKLIHQSCLENDLPEAIEHAISLVTEARILTNTLRLMKEKELCKSQSASN